jgi:uncharacterized membrane protein
MGKRKVDDASRPLVARLVATVGLVHGVVGWTLLIVVAGLFARTRAAWTALAIVYPFGLAPVFFIVRDHQRRHSSRG